MTHERSGASPTAAENRGDLRHTPSARVLPKHDPPPTTWRGEGPQRSLCPNLDLPRAGRAAKLLNAVGIHRGAGAPVSQIAAARAQRVRPLDPDIARVE